MDIPSSETSIRLSVMSWLSSDLSIVFIHFNREREISGHRSSATSDGRTCPSLSGLQSSGLLRSCQDMSVRNFITYNIEALKISSTSLWRHWILDNPAREKQPTSHVTFRTALGRPPKFRDGKNKGGWVIVQRAGLRQAYFYPELNINEAYEAFLWNSDEWNTLYNLGFSCYMEC